MGLRKWSLSRPRRRCGDEVCIFEDVEVLGDGLTGHVDAFAEFAEGLPIASEEAVEEQTAAGVGEGSEDQIGIHEENLCNHLVACQGHGMNFEFLLPHRKTID